MEPIPYVPVTVRLKVCVLVTPPPVALMVMGYLPSGVESDAAMLSAVPHEGKQVAGLK